MSPVLQLRTLAIGYGRDVLCADIGFSLAEGEVLCVLGPNGCGKTTLFRTLLGLLPPLGGEVQLLGKSFAGWSRRDFARQVGYVPQAHLGLFPFTVEDIVLMGRASHLGAFATPSAHDRAVANESLRSVGICHLAARSYIAISGGERQLVLIARALAQEPRLLVMDEPTASLDFGNQLRVLEHIDLLRGRGIAVLMSTHQPEHALRVADRIALLAPGRLLAVGPAQATATPANLAALYGVPEAALSGMSRHQRSAANPA